MGSCYSREGIIGFPVSRDMLGLPAWPPVWENHHCYFSQKQHGPQRKWVNRVPQANAYQPKHVVPRPSVHLRCLQRSQHLSTTPFAQFPQPCFSSPFPEHQILFEAHFWLPSPGLSSFYQTSRLPLETILQEANTCPPLLGGQEAWLFVSSEVCCGLWFRFSKAHFLSGIDWKLSH